MRPKRILQVVNPVARVLSRSLHRKPEIAYPLALIVAGTDIALLWFFPLLRTNAPLLVIALSAFLVLIYGRLGPAFVTSISAGVASDYLFLHQARGGQFAVSVLRLSMLLCFVLLAWLLRQAYLEKHVSLVERDQFLGTIAHELRNPISSILLRLNMMERRLHGDSDVISLERQVRRLLDLTNSLLDTARLHEGQLRLQPEPIKMSEVIQEVFDSYSENFASARCKAEVVILQDVDGCWDRIRLEQVFANLLSNACKYGEGAPISVIVTGTETEAQVSVKDSGMGIDPELHQVIFERYKRGPSKQKGFGLGLWVSDEIVKAHGGTIDVNSKPGEGSVFTVHLPYTSPTFRS